MRCQRVKKGLEEGGGVWGGYKEVRVRGGGDLDLMDQGPGKGRC